MAGHRLRHREPRQRRFVVRGARFDRPTLWLYGDQDPFYDIQHCRNNFMLFQTAGGQGTFLEFNVPGGSGHAVLSALSCGKDQ